MISAQSALDAILDGTENEYVKSFQDFTKSLEQFLTVERGRSHLINPQPELTKLLILAAMN